MDFVIDANIIFAALIKDNVTRFILFRDSVRIFAPEFIFSEIEKYSDEICEKSGKSKDDLDEALNVIMRRITIIPKEEMQPFLAKAREFSPDPKDVSYLALALKLKIPVWSNDRILKEKQGIVEIYNTNEVKEKTQWS